MPAKGEATPLLKQTPMLSPEEEVKTIQLPDGYQLELVLSEPDIKEPVVCVFDGNGRMYVAEMRTYMQDIDGTDELAAALVADRITSLAPEGLNVYDILNHETLVLTRAAVEKLITRDKVAAIKEILDRAHGKPSQTTDANLKLSGKVEAGWLG